MKAAVNYNFNFLNLFLYNNVNILKILIRKFNMYGIGLLEKAE